MLQVASLVIPLFGLVLLGFLAGKIRKIPLSGLAWINFFIVYLALPALFFRLLASTPVDEFSNAQFLLNTSLGTLFIFFLCFCIARFLRRTDTQVAAIQGFAGAYGNIGYMGPPLAIAAFGPQAGVPVALVFCIDNAMHFTLAPTLMAFGQRKQQQYLRLVITISRNIFTHPFILATLAGVSAAWFQFKPPAALDQLLLSLSYAAAPCALFVMGVTAALRPLQRLPPELLYLIPIKLIMHPLLLYLLLSQMPHLDPVWLYSAVLLAALPSATNVFVIAQQYQIWEQRASSVVVISTAMSIITITAYLYMSTTGVI